MQISTLILFLIASAIMAFWLGRQKAVSSVGGIGSVRNLHSLPSYYGFYSAIWVGIPGLILVLLWLSFGDVLVMNQALAVLPDALRNLPPAEMSLVVNDIRNIAAGQFVNPDSLEDLLPAVNLYLQFNDASRWILGGCLVLIVLCGFGFSWS
ncbi:MAG: phosphate ABC transporter permease family protein, partial [Gammaproteobacteria bacterium]|nr:phosphate ABC transporter permease family protein [Gammaproteobacteria bacterium]